MVQLQRPSHVFMNGDLLPWEEATIHVSSEALIRSASVFEGVKGYWDDSGDTFSLLALREHYDRLTRSARLLHLPFDMSFEAFTEACVRLVEQLLVPGRDLWLRPTIFAIEGHWGLDTVTDLVITGYTLPQQRPDPINIGVSTWKRAGDRVQPPRIKTSANYQVGRLARIEGRRRGYEDMLLLNSADRVGEATGSCVLIVRDGTVFTPPASEGCLESITVDIIERLCLEEGVPFVRRPVELTEMYLADEAFLAGTLAELVPVRSVEDEVLPTETPVLDRLADAFWETARGARKHLDIVLTEV
jgi:branched-chain amino acid aminotransferase